MPVFDTLIYDEHKANTADVMQAVNGLVRLPKSRNRHNVAPSLVAPMMLSDTMNYSRNLIPTSKVDLERAKAAIEAGYPAVEPILGIWRDAAPDASSALSRFISRNHRTGTLNLTIFS